MPLCTGRSSDDDSPRARDVAIQSALDVDSEQWPGGRQPHLVEAVSGWLGRTTSEHTRRAYRSDLEDFLAFAGVPHSDLGPLLEVVPEHVAAWREHLKARGLGNAAIRCKLVALRSLYSYLQLYGLVSANPAHGTECSFPNGSAGATPGKLANRCRGWPGDLPIAPTEDRESGETNVGQGFKIAATP